MRSDAQPAGLLQRLRTETSQAHLRAEARVRILEPSATLDEYRGYLACMYGFHAALEPLLCAHEGLERCGFEGQARGRAPLLAADLAAVGFDEARLQALPLCGELPPLQPLHAALGVAYVIEGSTLGGQFILRRFPLHDLKGKATAFFQAYGERTGPMWKRFTELLLRSVPEAEHAGCVRAANATFEALICWFDRCGLTARG